MSLIDKCDILNTSYIDTRYPVHWPTNYTKERAQKAEEAAEEIAKTIKGLLKKGGFVYPNV